MQRYVDRVVMVTGAGRGLGRAIAERFAAEGAHLALADIDAASVKDTADACAPGRTSATAVDVTDSAQVNEWVQATLTEFGRVDVLVNNAGILRDNRLERMTDDEWQTVVDVSLRGAFNGSRAVFTSMKERGCGRILSLSSVCWQGNFGQANYAAAKAGIVGLTRTIALEGARYGVTANALAPGTIETPMLVSLPGTARERLEAKIPMGRVGKPEDIAEAAAFLCSPAANYITGVVLEVDGGISVGLGR